VLPAFLGPLRPVLAPLAWAGFLCIGVFSRMDTYTDFCFIIVAKVTHRSPLTAFRLPLTADRVGSIGVAMVGGH
jgi:hypothetical protein